MSSVQVEQKSYEMPPRDGISIAHFLTVADIERSARYYEKTTHPNEIAPYKILPGAEQAMEDVATRRLALFGSNRRL